MQNQSGIWQARAIEHVEKVKNAWEALSWPEDSFNEHSFRSFGSYPGLAMLCFQLDKLERGKSQSLRSYLSDIPGVRDADNLYDFTANAVLIACEQIDLLMPLCIETMREKASTNSSGNT